jgi:hypothetical protein
MLFDSREWMPDCEGAPSSAESAEDETRALMRAETQASAGFVSCFRFCFRRDAPMYEWRFHMKGIRLLAGAGLLSCLVLAAAPGADAQGPVPMQFNGLLNDYSPSTVKGGPWEMHGQWTLSINPWSGEADFSADLTMSGYGKTSAGAPDPTQGGQSAHTHHIRLTKATVTWNTAGCPTYSPSTYGGFQVTGTVSLLTGNGSNAPFETTPPSSTLQVCVSGGEGNDSVPFSNITLTFGTGSPAISHFGPQPIHGVVRGWNQRWDVLRQFDIGPEGVK